ncbi:uncharacterized protein LOC123540275 [Mercenaria mercenaria]|uniref:uncharacterized protein LOC123540275 n=1 Tax=Mercenaria mercenaria TaxID=6596 RepID=UPI00234F5A90|nr:uncharacterized protein LOC123540275 [Mercenaria mercenaria]
MGPKRNRNNLRNGAFYCRRQNNVAMFFNINDSQPPDPNIREAVFQMDDFCQEVTNYTCALANGEQSGRIVIGQYADDNLSGYSYGSAEKDRLRSETIAAIKEVHPKIPGKDYRMQFVPFFDSDGKPQGNTEFLEISVKGTRKSWQRNMYRNANREIYTFRDGNVREAKGYEIEEILRRRYHSEQDKLRNGFKSEMEKLQAEKKRIEDSLQKYTEQFLNIKMKEFENTIDHRMGPSGGLKIDDTAREQTN